MEHLAVKIHTVAAGYASKTFAPASETVAQLYLQIITGVRAQFAL
jgi:hypothetical protein